MRKKVILGGFVTTGINVGDGNVGADTGVVGTTVLLVTIWNVAEMVRLGLLEMVARTVCVPSSMRLHRKKMGPSFPHNAYGALDSTRYCGTLFHPNMTDCMGEPAVTALTPKLGFAPGGIVIIAPSNRLATTVSLPPLISSNPMTCASCADVNLGRVTSATIASISLVVVVVVIVDVGMMRYWICI